MIINSRKELENVIKNKLLKNSKELDLTDIKKINVKDLSYLFYENESLIEINAEGVDFGLPTNLEYMCYGCKKLKKFKGHINTFRVKKTNYMFYGCGKLKQIDLEKFDLSRVDEVDGMFQKTNQKLKITKFKLFNNKNVMKALDCQVNNLFDKVGNANIKTVPSGFQKKRILSMKTPNYINKIEKNKNLGGKMNKENILKNLKEIKALSDLIVSLNVGNDKMERATKANAEDILYFVEKISKEVE